MALKFAGAKRTGAHGTEDSDLDDPANESADTGNHAGEETNNAAHEPAYRTNEAANHGLVVSEENEKETR